MCTKIKCAGLYTVALINNIYSRNVQTGCTGYIYIYTLLLLYFTLLFSHLADAFVQSDLQIRKSY